MSDRGGNIREQERTLNSFAKELRKNMTPEEKKLWYQYLSSSSFKWRRQKIVDSYILDFYCNELRVGIELDGSQHYSEEGLLKDRIRTETINNYNITIIRFCNIDIDKHFLEVVDWLDENLPLQSAKPTASP